MISPRPSLAIAIHLVFERLLQHIGVVLYGLCFRQILELAFRFLFCILNDIKDAAAVCLDTAAVGAPNFS